MYLGKILALSQILTSGNERVGSLLLGESDELDRMDEEAIGDEGTSFLQSGLDCCLPGLPDFREPLLLILRHCGDFYAWTASVGARTAPMQTGNSDDFAYFCAQSNQCKQIITTAGCSPPRIAHETRNLDWKP